ncbi:hypothetical protein BCV71DRAFT_229530 [Rhizopus microsporus]|uniref:Uncharacterized protein n=1 Tax=Rhizopus microsporus TaxID=58291 RepID=A0A1X0RPL9_RHIZD|nr:hypothetical protein BCV71DRAFT_229530 [Rhizopus microsporus]
MFDFNKIYLDFSNSYKKIESQIWSTRIRNFFLIKESIVSLTESPLKLLIFY